MRRGRRHIEDDEQLQRIILSMRTKATIVCICFFVVMGLVAYSNMPKGVRAFRGIILGRSLEQETPSEFPEQEPPEIVEEEPPEIVEEEPPLGESIQFEDNESSQAFVSVFFDDFNGLNQYYWWDFPSLTGLNYDSWAIDIPWRDTLDWSYHSLRDGYLFLNITNPPGDGASISNMIKRDGQLYQGVEIRLRCSDDNKLNSDMGGGTRSWGFGPPSYGTYGPALNFYGEDALCFASYSPESDPPLPGFWAVSRVNYTEIRKPITGVDITEWHNYSIIWVEGNATFLVDGVVVASIDNVPTQKMHVSLVLNNCFYRHGDWPSGFRYDYLNLTVNQSVQVDHVHIFWTEEQLEWIKLITQKIFDTVQPMMETHKNWIPASCLEEIQNTYALGENAWEDEQLSKAHEHFLGIVRTVQALHDLYFRAAEVINRAEKTGKHTDILDGMKNNYAAAIRSICIASQKDLADLDQAEHYLQTVIDTGDLHFAGVGEPALLSLLGLLLLSFTKRRLDK